MLFHKVRVIVGVTVAAGVVAGCADTTAYDTHGYLDRRESIELTAGDANASNIAVQMVDPWPRHAGDKNIAFNGQRMQAAVERYRNNQVIPPRGISASSVYAPQSSGSPTPPAANTTPVGPTVAAPVK